MSVETIQPPPPEVQTTDEAEVSYGSPERRLTDIQVVSIETVGQIGDVHVEGTTVVTEERQSPVTEDTEFVLSRFLGKHANVLDISGSEPLIEDDPVGLRTLLE